MTILKAPTRKVKIYRYIEVAIRPTLDDVERISKDRQPREGHRFTCCSIGDWMKWRGKNARIRLYYFMLHHMCSQPCHVTCFWYDLCLTFNVDRDLAKNVNICHFEVVDGGKRGDPPLANIYVTTNTPCISACRKADFSLIHIQRLKIKCIFIYTSLGIGWHDCVMIYSTYELNKLMVKVAINEISNWILWKLSTYKRFQWHNQLYVYIYIYICVCTCMYMCM